MIDSKKLAKDSRKYTLELVSASSSSHVGSSLSVIDILAVLYSKKINQKRNSDCIILSKGHAAAGFYAILANLGLISKDVLNHYCLNGSKFGGHITHSASSEVEFSTGSLGHGLPFSAGKTYSFKLDGKNNKVFVVISDGECDEGTTWESALFAAHHGLSNLYLFIDRNRLQSLESTEDTLKLEPLAEKWRAFGWEVREIDGHSHEEIFQTLEDLVHIDNKPKVIISNTTKGKGVSFMENSVAWHYRAPNQKQLEEALKEIEVS